MRDITRKQITLRTADAVAFVACSATTIALIKNNQLPKGDPFGIAKAAAFLGAKQTASLIPHCHPVTIDGMSIQYHILEPNNPLDEYTFASEYGVVIFGEAKSIGKTGIEMEILTGVSIAALTIYDLLKPVDKNISIENTRLLDKKGGKTDKKKYFERSHQCSIIVCSDAVVEGKKTDVITALVNTTLLEFNANISKKMVVAQEALALKKAIEESVSRDDHFVFICGGTGQSNTDISAAVVDEITDKKLDGIIDAMRHYSLDRSGIAMVSRLAAGIKERTTIITIPGSSTGAQESLDAIMPYVFHLRKMLV